MDDFFTDIALRLGLIFIILVILRRISKRLNSHLLDKGISQKKSALLSSAAFIVTGSLVWVGIELLFG